MCEDSRMDEFAAAYLRYDATLTLTPGPVASAGPESLAAYPAREVATAIARARSVRWFSRRLPDAPSTVSLVDWEALRWRWREDDRELVLGFSARLTGAEAVWTGSPVVAHCNYEDVARLAVALGRRFPALRLLLEDGHAYTPADFIASVAQARLAPALASDDLDTRERAFAAQAVYAELLDSVARPVDPLAAFAAAPFTTLYEDARMVAVNKPAGVITHPTYKHPDGTLTDAVFAQHEAQGAPRPWLLHRLDKDTSGVILFARSDQARRSLTRQFERHTARKRYLALVVRPASLAPDNAQQEIDAPLARDPLDRRRVIVSPDGQPSRTRYRTLAAVEGYALVLAEPVTGRTHQIRAHLAAIGAPLVGDAAYLPDESPARRLAPRVMLHAWRLDLCSPGTEEPWSVTAPPPDDFINTAQALGLGDALRAALADDAGAVA